MLLHINIVFSLCFCVIVVKCNSHHFNQFFSIFLFVVLNIREEITTYFESVSTKYKLDDCSKLDIILYMFSRLHLAGSLSNDTSIIYLSCSTGCVANPRQFSLRPIDVNMIICYVYHLIAKTVASLPFFQGNSRKSTKNRL